MNHTPKLSKACHACRERKLKCDASLVGLPCTRCVDRGCRNGCVLVNRHPRARRAKPKPSPRDAVPRSDVSQERQRPFPTPDSELHNDPRPPDGAPDQSIDENQFHLQVCREIAMGRGLPSSNRILATSSPGHDLIEYYNGRNYITILGETMGNQQARHLTRIVVNDGAASHVYSKEGHDRDLAGLDAPDIKYLCEKNAFAVPPKAIWQLWLVLAHLCRWRRSEKLGSQLTMPRRSLSSAMRSCCMTLDASAVNFAVFNSMLLGISVFDYTVEKDFRFWLYNAVRIATRMGFHRREIAHDMDHSFHRLCRRIWWVIFSRDIMLSTCGLENIRILHQNDFDTPTLQESDWDEKEIPDQYKYLLDPISRSQKLYIIENCKLSTIAAKYLAMYQIPDSVPTIEAEKDLVEAFSMWRRALPEDMRMESIPQWTVDNVWILQLMAFSYRIECTFYRTLQKRYYGKDENLDAWAKQRLYSAMFELDAVIGRVATHGVIKMLPLSFINCITNVLALHIEVAMDPAAPAIQKSLATTHITAGILTLREVEDHWYNVPMSLKLFEWVLEQNGLQGWDKARSQRLNPKENTEAQLPEPVPEVPQDLMDDFMGSTVRDSTGWFEDLAGFGFMDTLPMQYREWENEMRHDQ